MTEELFSFVFAKLRDGLVQLISRRLAKAGVRNVTRKDGPGYLDLIGPIADAIVQDGVLEWWGKNKFEECQTQKDVSTGLRKFCNVVFVRWRRNNFIEQQRFGTLGLESLDHASSVLYPFAPTIPTPYKVLFLKKQEKLLLGALWLVPNHIREAIELKYVDEESWQVVAEQCDLPVETLQYEISSKWFPLLRHVLEQYRPHPNRTWPTERLRRVRQRCCPVCHWPLETFTVQGAICGHCNIGIPKTVIFLRERYYSRTAPNSRRPNVNAPISPRTEAAVVETGIAAS